MALKSAKPFEQQQFGTAGTEGLTIFKLRETLVCRLSYTATLHTVKVNIMMSLMTSSMLRYPVLACNLTMEHHRQLTYTRCTLHVKMQMHC